MPIKSYRISNSQYERFKYRNNLVNNLALALQDLTFISGGIGANIHNLDELNHDFLADDVNDG